MIVSPTINIRKCGDVWREMIDRHFQCPVALHTIDIEARSSELCVMLHKLKQDSKLRDDRQRISNYGPNTSYGPNTPKKVSELTEAILDLSLFF